MAPVHQLLLSRVLRAGTIAPTAGQHIDNSCSSLEAVPELENDRKSQFAPPDFTCQAAEASTFYAGNRTI
jgi:hypothetical protein